MCSITCLLHSLRYALDVIAQTNALLAEVLITEAGCDGIYYCVQSAEYDRFLPEEYRTAIRPSDLYVLEHGKRELILGGDCTIDSKIDWERIRWIVEAARSI